MITPRKGETISVLPYGSAVVERMVDQGRCLVTVDRMVKTKTGVTNRVIVELHPVWIVSEVVEQ